MASIDINDVLEGATQKAQKAQGESLKTFLASITTSAIVCALVVVAATFLEWRFPKFYHPRTQNASAWQAESLWPRMILFPMSDPNTKAITKLDNYLFERYLHTILRIFIPIAFLSLPILLPLIVIDGKNESSGIRGLDRLTFGNIGLSHTARYWAHFAVAIGIVLYVCLVLRYELEFYARLRQMVQSHGASIGSTILLTSSSRMPLTIEAIKRHFGAFSGGVCTIKMNRDQQSFLSNPNPSWLIAAIQGLAPTIMLALINSIVLIAIRLLAGFQGLHFHQAVESSIQLYYFTFLFVQVSFIVSVSTSIAISLSEVPNALISVPATLAQNLPKASNYFFSYIIMFTFGTITATLIRVEKIVQQAILSPLFDKTPRQKWTREENILVKNWGTLLVFSSLYVIPIIKLLVLAKE